MSRTYEFYSEFEQHNGKTVMIDGMKCRLEVSVSQAIYPYDHKAISVYATPISKNSKHYRESKAILKDDWSYDVLESFDLECDILRQLKAA